MKDEIALRDDMTTNQLITRLRFEATDAGHDLGTFTSFLRVCCGRYLPLIADGELERDDDGALADLQAPAILQRETERTTSRMARLAQPRNRISRPD